MKASDKMVKPNSPKDYFWKNDGVHNIWLYCFVKNDLAYCNADIQKTDTGYAYCIYQDDNKTHKSSTLALAKKAIEKAFNVKATAKTNTTIKKNPKYNFIWTKDDIAKVKEDIWRLCTSSGTFLGLIVVRDKKYVTLSAGNKIRSARLQDNKFNTLGDAKTALEESSIKRLNNVARKLSAKKNPTAAKASKIPELASSNVIKQCVFIMHAYKLMTTTQKTNLAKLMKISLPELMLIVDKSNNYLENALQSI